jgi:hypothetical protein
MPSDPGWLLRKGPFPVDATARFHELYGTRARADARVLLVPGIFTDRYPWYLRKVRRALRARELAIDTEGTVRQNAAAIRDAVLREREPVVLMGHSKGPIDIHAALCLHPEIVPRVRAFVSLQAPFAGTPLATDAKARPLLRALAPDSFFEMGYDERRAFLAQHRPEPPVPTVALATFTSRAGWPLEKTRRYIAGHYGERTDGFVPFVDAQIPGARLVALTGIDHAAVALPWLRPFAPLDAGRAATALVALALEH